ncbi:lysylphosphatidylglycerol synthase transmembrane domain-containing protein [Tellurirhabdus bombi]|uniref:lysylphosphatidylglycerol synthase transmembrane domain-containing protein n=1 Tax=Tellurirhabdus bombi TaxID=2907205 RepID=UPI001F3005A1|nr:lysylphosphatidylglycerol synthase transmembrane domain-containing protein [Tellurirhabdus bombi]
MARKIPAYLKTSLKIGLTGLSLWLVFRKIEPEQVWAVIKQVHVGWLVLATGLYLVSRVLGAERLRLLFRQIGLNINFGPSLKLYWLGMYYNLFLPGGIGGDGYKVYLLNRLTATPVKSLLAATLFDRIIGIFPLGYMLAALAVFLPSLPVLDAIIPYRWLFLGLIPLGYFGASWLLRRFWPEFSPVFNRATLQSIGVQVAQMIEIIVLLYAMQASGAWAAYLAIFLLSSIVSIIPFTIGGAGSRELTFLLGAQLFGLPADEAVAISLLFYVITALVSLSGIVFSYSETILIPPSPVRK